MPKYRDKHNSIGLKDGNDATKFVSNIISKGVENHSIFLENIRLRIQAEVLQLESGVEPDISPNDSTKSIYHAVTHSLKEGSLTVLTRGGELVRISSTREDICETLTHSSAPPPPPVPAVA
jgi:hypothetical protein